MQAQVIPKQEAIKYMLNQITGILKFIDLLIIHSAFDLVESMLNLIDNHFITINNIKSNQVHLIYS